MAEKRTLSAREMAADIRAGATDEFLLRKYGVSERALQRLFQKLLDAKILTQNDFDSRTPDVLEGEAVAIEDGQLKSPSDQESVQAEWRCPNCKKPQQIEYDECPECGVIVSKFEKLDQLRKRQTMHKQERERQGKQQQETTPSKTTRYKCPKCGYKKSESFEKCPECGFADKKSVNQLLWILVVCVLSGCFLVSYIIESAKKETSKPSSSYSSTSYSTMEPGTTQAEIQVEHLIKLALKNPSSANFSNVHAEKLGDGRFRVSGVVSGTNSFNATTTEPFSVIIRWIGGDPLYDSSWVIER
jgi:hypothetical protein